jgi:mannan polymerase II complex MNN11 subunit
MPTIGSYDLKGAPFSWTKVYALRNALTLWPDCSFIWFLGQDSFIMEPELDIKEHIMKAGKLEAMMIKDHPVVPPDSIIKTFNHLKANDIDLVITQDNEGLSSESMIIRNGDWAKFFLETWYDPIYRSYNFQKAEEHALVSLQGRRHAIRCSGTWPALLTSGHTYRNTLSSGILQSFRDSL